jgi:hypothetical protein
VKRLLEPEFQAKFHAVMTVVWAVLTIPALIWWKESILWVIVLSQWANVASHWAGFQAAHAEKRTKQQQ